MGTFQSFPQTFYGSTSDFQTTPYPHALGTKARDNAGNEYVYCNVSSNTIAPEMAVLINEDWSIEPVSSTTQRGPVGVVADLTKSGNTSAPVSPYPASAGVWVQIYGRTFVMLSGADSSPSDTAALNTLGTSLKTVFRPATSGAATPGGSLQTTDWISLTSTVQWLIEGMTVAHDTSLTTDTSGAVSAVSATHTGLRAAVWLNYPSIVTSAAVPSVT